MTEDLGPPAFAGIRVLDLTSSTAGAIASMYLADFGADVLRVEAGNAQRLSAAYIFANRGKRLIDSDPATLEGQRLVQALIVRGDILVIDGSATRLAELSCDAETLCAADPALSICGCLPTRHEGPCRLFRPMNFFWPRGRAWRIHSPGRRSSLSHPLFQ